MVFCMMVAPFGVPKFHLMVRHYSTVERPFNTMAHLFRVCYAMRSIRLRNDAVRPEWGISSRAQFAPALFEHGMICPTRAATPVPTASRNRRR